MRVIESVWMSGSSGCLRACVPVPMCACVFVCVCVRL